MGFGRRRRQQLPGWVRDPLWRRAQRVPTLDLDFAGTRGFTDKVTGRSLLTISRASTATTTGPTGSVDAVASGVARLRFNPAPLACEGLLVEEQRTNSIRNNTMVGAVAGTPGTLPTNWTQLGIASGLTRQIVGTGTTNGIDYIDIRLSGTTADANGWNIGFEGSTTVAASSGQAWTHSVYLAVVGGSFANINSFVVRVVERASGGTLVGTTDVSMTSAGGTLTAASRFASTRASLGGTAAFAQPTLFMGISSGAAIDITLRIGMPQLEQGATATSVIPTSGSQVTRLADVVSITGSDFAAWYRQDEGTLYINAISNAPLGTGSPRPVSLSNGSNSNLIEYLGSTDASVNLQAQNASVLQVNINQSCNALTANRLAAAYKADDFAFSSNGATAATDTSGSVPNIDRLHIGNRQDLARAWNGTIARLTYWNAALPTALSRLTAP